MKMVQITILLVVVCWRSLKLVEALAMLPPSETTRLPHNEKGLLAPNGTCAQFDIPLVHDYRVKLIGRDSEPTLCWMFSSKSLNAQIDW